MKNSDLDKYVNATANAFLMTLHMSYSDRPKNPLQNDISGIDFMIATLGMMVEKFIISNPEYPADELRQTMLNYSKAPSVRRRPH